MSEENLKGQLQGFWSREHNLVEAVAEFARKFDDYSESIVEGNTEVIIDKCLIANKAYQEVKEALKAYDRQGE